MTLADSLFNRGALQEFILIAGQYPAGGLRDKPPKQAQFFSFLLFICVLLHCLQGCGRLPYCLLHIRPVRIAAPCVPFGDAAGRDSCRVEWRRRRSCYGFCRGPELGRGRGWLSRRRFGCEPCSMSRVSFSRRISLLRELQNATHPLFDLTITHAEGIMAHFYKQTIPKRAWKRSH